jgi:hypothetical protein
MQRLVEVVRDCTRAVCVQSASVVATSLYDDPAAGPSRLTTPPQPTAQTAVGCCGAPD